MKRVKREETIVNKSPYLTEESDDLLTVLPLDLKIEIFLKLPAKSAAKLNFVSNGLSSIIRGKYFTNLYLARSSTRPRLLFTVRSRDAKYYFLSSSQEDPLCDHVKVKIPVMKPNEDGWCEYSPPIRGLICCHNRANVWIVNPSTGQIQTLPRVSTTGGRIFTYFGHDPVNDEYKVLYMTVRSQDRSRDVSHDHQVFTLGAQQKEWRRIKCKHPHRPCRLRKGLCMNGVVYYNARITSETSLISFDLRSEEFNVVKVSKDISKFYNLVNYSGKIALTDNWFYGTLDFRVLEDVSKQEWSTVSVVVPFWEDLAEDNFFRLIGALSTGELIFAPISSINPFYIISYDTKENKAKRVVIEGIGDNLTEVDEVLCDHVDSPMFLSKIN